MHPQQKANALSCNIERYTISEIINFAQYFRVDNFKPGEINDFCIESLNVGTHQQPF